MSKKSFLKHSKIKKLSEWLKDKRTDVLGGKYCHLLLIEQLDKKNDVIGELAEYFNQAYEPFRQYIRELLGYSLNPLENNADDDPARGYPENLHPLTLQGYFGEVFAGIVAEHYELLGSDEWEVPVFLFHSHDVAFQQLELARQSGKEVKHVPGRTGDDCLAFVRNDDGKIVRIMFCEAKCSAGHNATLIKDAHEKISSSNIIPVDISKVIEALQFVSDKKDADKWANALRRVYFERDVGRERCDMVLYICGRTPKKDETWISITTPHQSYKGGRKLMVAEIQLTDVADIVKDVHARVKELL